MNLEIDKGQLASALEVTPPIQETDDSVFYLGVRLEKATDSSSQFVPQREQYADFINDRFSLDLQRQIAVSFHQGDPILIEGGTSIGKTTTVRKMAAELGWEVHYANLNGATDVEDLMGRYIPNPNKHGPEDPEYIFADGKVTSGLRVEDGKTKVIIIDEFNAASPNILIRLHEVLDALGRGENVVLAEDASETVPVDKNATKIAALMNPPGKGYFGREPLDPAQLRRWIYIKAPTDLPEDTFSYSTDALFSLAPQDQVSGQQDHLVSRDLALLPEQLQEIPGIAEVLARYKEFHRSAKEMVRERRVGADQPQPFTYDDRVDPRRVRDFVLAFYNGDINSTFQEALRYYYVNKLEDPVDREKLEELMRHVQYTPSSNTSARRGVTRGEREENSQPQVETDVIPDARGFAGGEQAAWLDSLGKRIDVPPVPDSVTPEVFRNLERMGLELRYIPALPLLPLRDLKVRGVESYLDILQSNYPNWRRYESLSDEERENHAIGRNLNEWFWERVKEGDVGFPSLPGQWMAVETVGKPAYGDKYPRTPLAEKLGFRDDRFNVSWNDANAAIAREKRRILADIGLPSADLRQLEAIEWNLLANREGWGKTDTYEWTNTEYRALGDSYRLVVGYSGLGGAALATWDSPEYSDDGIGFRVAVVIPPSSDARSSDDDDRFGS